MQIVDGALTTSGAADTRGTWEMQWETRDLCSSHGVTAKKSRKIEAGESARLSTVVVETAALGVE
jgi:hypothetical protein